MKVREFFVVGGLVALLVLLWLGFNLHQSRDFAGSLTGGLLAVSGSLLMLVPFAYLVIKRIKPLKLAVTKRISMQTLLVVHIYAGVLGPILVIMHTGHKFSSPLGIALTTMTIIIVVSGFVGRYLMRSEGQEIKEKSQWLADLTAAFERTQKEIKSNPSAARELTPVRSLFGRLALRTLVINASDVEVKLPLASRALALSESIADVEFAIRTHETFRREFSVWLKLHIILSFVLYALLGLHIWAEIYFGIRWFA